MSYVINGLKAEIKNLKRYIEFCSDRSVDSNEETSRQKYRKEIVKTRKLIQQHRDAINVLNAHKKSKVQ